jgi:hypothetical protein
VQVYVALAKIDPDAAWCQLHAAVLSSAGEDIVATNDTPKTAGLHLKSEGRALVFPIRQEIAPQLVGVRASQGASGSDDALWKTIVPAGLRECTLSKLRSMQKEVEQMDAPWHRRINDPSSTA